jgi:hypothetical protein
MGEVTARLIEKVKALKMVNPNPSVFNPEVSTLDSEALDLIEKVKALEMVDPTT